LVLHHHLVQVTFREIPYIALASSVLFDAEAVVRWIVQHRVDLVLHGHMHQPFIERITRPILGTKRWHSFHVASVGRVGVAIDHLGDERYNTYGLINFFRDRYEIDWRRIDSKLQLGSEHRTYWKYSIPIASITNERRKRRRVAGAALPD